MVPPSGPYPPKGERWGNERSAERPEQSSPIRVETDAIEAEADLPPVVARLVVEIRSDGSRTIARGALEDRISGEKVALHADASTPVALVQQLTGALLRTPVLAGQTLRTLLPQAMGDLVPRAARLPKIISERLKKKR